MGSVARVQHSAPSAATAQPFPHPTENPFRLHSPAHPPRADLTVFPPAWEASLTCLSTDPCSVPEGGSLVREILRRDGTPLRCVWPGPTVAVSPACWAARRGAQSCTDSAFVF